MHTATNQKPTRSSFTLLHQLCCASAPSSASGAIASPGSSPCCAPHCGSTWNCAACSNPVGQPEVAADSWARQNKPTCPDWADAMGQPPIILPTKPEDS